MTLFSETWTGTLFCMTVRLGMVLLFSPIDAIRQLPVRVRLILTFATALILIPGVSPAHIQTETLWFIALLAECMNGLMMLLGLQAAFTTFQIAGQLIDNQMGLNSLFLFNPATHVQESFSGRFLSLFAIWIFFAEGYHRLLFQALKTSFTLAPPGQLMLLHDLGILKQIGNTFAMGILLSAPIVTGLLAIDLSAAILTRNMPQVSTWFLVLPLKILAGIFFLSLSLKSMHPVIQRIFAGVYS